MKSFPIFINLIHKPVLVVGGGDVALRKIDMLLKADAKITVIGSKLCNELKELKEINVINLSKIKEREDEIDNLKNLLQIKSNLITNARMCLM